MSERPSFLRRAAAGIFDFLTVFAVGGYIIAKLTGNTTDAGFQLNGWPAAILFALIIGYFYLGWKVVGGTLWQRIFKAH